MTPRNVEPITSAPGARDGRDDNHPAFAVASVTRSSGTPRSLFQSDLRHNETIRLTVSTAERTRDLNRDWVHPRQALIEVEMSLSQWGALVSSIGLGSGVPVTLRYTHEDGTVADLPYEPRIAESVTETKSAVSKMLERARVTLEALEAAVESKSLKAMRAALSAHKVSLEHAESNSAFAVNSLKEAAETVTHQARADIEAQILTAQQIIGGRVSIEAPSGYLALDPTRGSSGSEES
jgi:hypothetical protein